MGNEAHVLSLGEKLLSEILLAQKNPEVEKALWDGRKYCRTSLEEPDDNWQRLEEDLVARFSTALGKIFDGFFKNLNPGIIDRILGRMVVQVAPAETVILKMGDISEEFFFITRGACQVLVDGCQVAMLERGSFFGGNSLVSKTAQKSTIITAQSTQFIKCHRKDVQVAMLQQVATQSRMLKKTASSSWLKNTRASLQKKKEIHRDHKHKQSLKLLEKSVSETITPQLDARKSARLEKLRLNMPCFKCGKVGHVAIDCLEPQELDPLTGMAIYGIGKSGATKRNGVGVVDQQLGSTVGSTIELQDYDDSDRPRSPADRKVAFIQTRSDEA